MVMYHIQAAQQAYRQWKSLELCQSLLTAATALAAKIEMEILGEKGGG